MRNKIRSFLAHPLLTDYRLLGGLWLLLGIIAALTKLHANNNFMIFRGVFWHTWQQLPLYVEYPAEYFDTNYYGPLFSVVVMPFAVVPVWMGMLMWCVALAMGLYVAVRRSLLTDRQQVFVLWFCAHELLTALFMQQFNVAIAAIILLSFFLIEKERDASAAFFIVVGTMVKLYGIVGLAFFFFSRHKGRFVLSLIGWSLILFALPMLISSPEYVTGQYQEWFAALTSKNDLNQSSIAQNISLLGMVRRISGCMAYSDLWLIVPGLVLFALPYLRLKQYRHMAFRQTLLASVLMFCVLFSTGSESSGYIIALVGVAVWYTAAPWQRSRWDVALMVFAFVLTSLSPSDLFPAYLRKEWVQPYALKALPVAIIWLKLCWEMMTKDYGSRELGELREPRELGEPRELRELGEPRELGALRSLRALFDRTFITFLLVGVVNTLFGTAIMFILYNAFGCSYWVSSFCDYFFGSILSYFLNKHFTFKFQGSTWQSILRFALNIVVCYLIAYSAALPLTRYALESMHFSKTIVENIAMLVGTVLFMVINYLGQKFYAFKQSS